MFIWWLLGFFCEIGLVNIYNKIDEDKVIFYEFFKYFLLIGVVNLIFEW